MLRQREEHPDVLRETQVQLVRLRVRELVTAVSIKLFLPSSLTHRKMVWLLSVASLSEPSLMFVGEAPNLSTC